MAAEERKRVISEASQRLNNPAERLAALQEIGAALTHRIRGFGVYLPAMLDGKLDAILQTLEDPDEAVRHEALSVVGKLTPHGGLVVVEKLANTTLNDRNSGLVIQTLDVIGRFGADLASHVIDQIAHKLGHSDPSVQSGTFDLLLSLGNDAKSVAPQLVKWFLDNPADERNLRWRGLLGFLGTESLAEQFFQCEGVEHGVVLGRLRTIGAPARDVRRAFERLGSGKRKPQKEVGPWIEPDSRKAQILKLAGRKRVLARNLMFLWRELIHDDTARPLLDWWNKACKLKGKNSAAFEQHFGQEGFERLVQGLKTFKFKEIDDAQGTDKARSLVERGIVLAKEFVEQVGLPLNQDSLLYIAKTLAADPEFAKP